MIIGTITVTLGAIIIGVPVGLCCAIFMSEYAPVKVRNAFRPAIQLLAGIPSVVYGFIGLITVVPFIQNFIGGPGLSLLAGSIILAIMILPTIISISEVSLTSLPRQYKEGALALGMTQWQSIWRVQIPAAKQGIIASFILGIGRAVGETMAVIMVLGNAPSLPSSILDPIRTLTTNIGLEFGYAEGTHRQALFATGVVLFIIIMIINSFAQYLIREHIKKTKKKKHSSTEANAALIVTKNSDKGVKAEKSLAKIACEEQKVNFGSEKKSRIGAVSGKSVVWTAAILVMTILIAIIIYILVMGLQELKWEFLKGVSPIVVGTLCVTVLALLIAIPLGVGAAFFLAEYTKNNLFTRIIRFSVESLAGIPSIIYGLFGFVFFVIRLDMGWSILAGGLTLAIMVLPTIIRTTEEAIKAVPKSYRETSYSLGATKWQTIRKAVFPSALGGIVNGIILSIGRCVAETAAIMLTVGSVLKLPGSIFDSVRTMASHFYLLVMEEVDFSAAFGTAVLLLIFVFLINIVANALVNRFISKRNR